MVSALYKRTGRLNGHVVKGIEYVQHLESKLSLILAIVHRVSIPRGNSLLVVQVPFLQIGIPCVTRQGLANVNVKAKAKQQIAQIGYSLMEVCRRQCFRSVFLDQDGIILEGHAGQDVFEICLSKRIQVHCFVFVPVLAFPHIRRAGVQFA